MSLSHLNVTLSSESSCGDSKCGTINHDKQDQRANGSIDVYFYTKAAAHSKSGCII